MPRNPSAPTWRSGLRPRASARCSAGSGDDLDGTLVGAMSLRTGSVRFAVMNKVVNPFVGAVLRSPLHRLLSARLALLTVTGRRSGDVHTFPVAYEQEGDRVRITVGWPEQKRWWRNLRGGAPLRIRLRGRELAGYGEVMGDERIGIAVEVRLGREGADDANDVKAD